MWSSPVFFCRNGPCCQQKSPGGLAGPSGAVSYTHLDVYKRQLLGVAIVLELVVLNILRVKLGKKTKA